VVFFNLLQTTVEVSPNVWLGSRVFWKHAREEQCFIKTQSSKRKLPRLILQEQIGVHGLVLDRFDERLYFVVGDD
jgi:hypothetical protein